MNKNTKKSGKKKKLNIKRLVIFLLFLYLIYNLVMQYINMPIKHIFITGNNYVTDNEIITSAGIKNYPPIFTLNIKNINNKLLKNNLIEEIKINKKINGTLNIAIKEIKPLFIKKENQLIIIDFDREISNDQIIGLPTLVNYVPNTLYEEFIKEFKKIDDNIIAMMNYIEYQPSKNVEGEVIDEKRFLITMNDGNTVYTNPDRLENLNYYLNILSTLGGKKGVLNLDAGNYFKPY